MTQSAATHSPNEGEKSLVAGCLTGDKRAWDHFFDSHYGTVLAVAGWKQWRFDPQEVEDVAQEIMTEIIRALRSFEFKSSLGTFVYKVAVNTCIAHLRMKTAMKRKALSAEAALDPIESGTDDRGGLICTNPGKSQEDLLLERESLSLLKTALVNPTTRLAEFFA
jgi:RNA polymerase sigma factor (sigma-70 family)